MTMAMAFPAMCPWPRSGPKTGRGLEAQGHCPAAEGVLRLWPMTVALLVILLAVVVGAAVFRERVPLPRPTARRRHEPSPGPAT